jgi:hypothetical protein
MNAFLDMFDLSFLIKIVYFQTPTTFSAYFFLHKLHSKNVKGKEMQINLISKSNMR